MYYIIYKETLVLSKYKLGTSTFKMSADTQYENFWQKAGTKRSGNAYLREFSCFLLL